MSQNLYTSLLCLETPKFNFFSLQFFPVVLTALILLYIYIYSNRVHLILESIYVAFY
jgi:hypothetical protein